MIAKTNVTSRIRNALATHADLPAEVREVLAEAAILLEVQCEGESRVYDLIPLVVSRLIPQRDERDLYPVDFSRAPGRSASGNIGGNGGNG